MPAPRSLQTYAPPSASALRQAHQAKSRRVTAFAATSGALLVAAVACDYMAWHLWAWVFGVPGLLTSFAFIVTGVKLEAEGQYVAADTTTLEALDQLKTLEPIAQVLKRIAAQGRPISQAEADWMVHEARLLRDRAHVQDLQSRLGVPVRPDLF
jgi:hypothetical protein